MHEVKDIILLNFSLRLITQKAAESITYGCIKHTFVMYELFILSFNRHIWFSRTLIDKSYLICKEMNYPSYFVKYVKICILRSRGKLCCFQTSLPLATLPLRRVIIACCFRVGALSGNAALALSPSGISPELNRIQLSAICRGGQGGKVIDLLA